MRRKRGTPPPALHVLEAEVMKELWSRGEAPGRVVLEALNERSERPRAYTTIMTTMGRLERKGLLVRRRDGQTDIYKPTLDRDTYRHRRASAQVEALVDEFGDAALAHFAQQVDRLDPERREELRRIAEHD
jgi:BlaI family transcriptional regulator, penicillinase repressor